MNMYNFYATKSSHQQIRIYFQNVKKTSQKLVMNIDETELTQWVTETYTVVIIKVMK